MVLGKVKLKYVVCLFSQWHPALDPVWEYRILDNGSHPIHLSPLGTAIIEDMS